VVIESFLAIPFLLTGTQRAAMLQRRAADKLAALGPLRVLELPVSPPDLVEALWWHPSREGDPGHRWLQQLFLEAAGTLPASGAGVTPASG
jgi:DNA-binding transcriptional LysR family regulator